MTLTPHDMHGLSGKGNASFVAKPSESDILNGCIRLLYAWGLDPIRNNTGGFSKKHTSKKTGKTKTHFIRFGKKGSGDILVCGARGQWVEIEAKADDGEQSPEQWERQAHVESKGGVYLLIRSVDELEAAKGMILRDFSKDNLEVRG